MRKVFLLFLSFFIFLFILSSSTLAFETWQKSADNSLKFTSSFSEAHRLQPYVLYENGTYKMWYTTIIDNQYKIGYATSTDGINWTTQAVLHPNPQLHNHDPHFLKTNNGLVLFFAATPGWGIKIYKISMINDSGFDPNTLKEIITPSLWWEENGAVSEPSVIFDNGQYYLFYTAAGNIWRLGMAYSSDLENWTKCPDPILKSYNQDEPGGGPSIFKKDGRFYLFYHSPNASGIKLTQSDDPISCGMNWSTPQYILTKDKNYDQNHMIAPTVIEKDNQLQLFYSGLSSSNIWTMNLAASNLAIPKYPIIIIPGFMNSWNKEAVLHNQTVSIFDWKLLSFVKEYNGLINSLKNLNQIENQDFLVFPYDWRKSVEETTNNLNTFLQQKIWNNNPNQKINLVGHSLGGLIGRIFTQKNKDKVNKIISVGSPHQGLVQVYKPLEAGEIDREDTFLWLAEKLILILNKSAIETDRETVQKRFPVGFDLFPTFNFLKDSNSNEIPVNDLIIKNTFLQTYNQNFSDIFQTFISIFGEKDNQTPAGFVIEPANALNQLLGNYKDGQPKTVFYDAGDYTVLSKSASQDTDAEKLIFDHGEIITKKEAIKKILSLLNITYQENQIVEGQKTIISPSLIFLIKSPASMEVNFNGKIYSQEDGIIFIEDAQSGDYQLKVKGEEKGQYAVIVGQIGNQTDQWTKIQGEITQEPPTSQIDIYPLGFNSQFPQPPLSPQSSFDELIYSLTDLNKSFNLPQITYSIKNLKQAKNLYQNNQKKKLKSLLLLTHSYLIIARTKKTDIDIKNKIIIALEKLENLYSTALSGYTEGISSSRINQALSVYKQKAINAESYLLTQKNIGKNISSNALVLQTIYNKFKLAEMHIGQNNLNFAEILLKTAGDLSNEIKKL